MMSTFELQVYHLKSIINVYFKIIFNSFKMITHNGTIKIFFNNLKMCAFITFK